MGSKKKISHSSYGAEFISFADADDLEYYLETNISATMQRQDILHPLLVDSKGLYDTIKTLYERHDFRLRQTVQCTGDSFKTHDIEKFRWIGGKHDREDALAKRNRASLRFLNSVLFVGYLNLPDHRSFELGCRV